MKFIGPYQIAVLEADAQVSRVDDWEVHGISVNSGLGQVKGEATTEAIQVASADATQKADTARQDANAYTRDVLNTSRLDLDNDGTPFFRPGSMTLSVHMDTDGNPFFLEA